MTRYSLYINFHSEMGECADGSPLPSTPCIHIYPRIYVHTCEHVFRLQYLQFAL